MIPSEIMYLLLTGLKETLLILSVSVPLSIVLGIVLGVLRVYGYRPAAVFAATFTALFRGFPLVVTLLIMFMGLPEIGIYLSPYWAATIAFVLCSGAYQSEYVRTALLSVEKTQLQAALAIGMTKLEAMRYILLPQALRYAVPGISNEIIYLIKYSSLAYIIGVPELFSKATSLNSLYFEPTIIFGLTALIYLAMTTTAHTVFLSVEKKLRLPGYTY